MLRIIVVGERLLAQKIVRTLSGRKVYVAAFSGLQGALSLLKQDDFDLVLVDAGLSARDSTCAQISQQCPVAIALVVAGPPANAGNPLPPNVDGIVFSDCPPPELET